MTIATTTTATRTTAKFAKLADGSWGVRITGTLMETGTQIRVNKAGGTMTTVITGATISSFGNVHTVRIVATPRPTTTATRSTSTTYAGERARMIRGCADCARQGKMCWTCQHDELDN